VLCVGLRSFFVRRREGSAGQTTIHHVPITWLDVPRVQPSAELEQFQHITSHRRTPPLGDIERDVSQAAPVRLSAADIRRQERQQRFFDRPSSGAKVEHSEVTIDGWRGPSPFLGRIVPCARGKVVVEVTEARRRVGFGIVRGCFYVRLRHRARRVFLRLRHRARGRGCGRAGHERRTDSLATPKREVRDKFMEPVVSPELLKIPSDARLTRVRRCALELPHRNRWAPEGLGLGLRAAVFFPGHGAPIDALRVAGVWLGPGRCHWRTGVDVRARGRSLVRGWLQQLGN